MKIPQQSLEVAGLTDDDVDPASGIQFAVLDPSGKRHKDGDQSWVAYGTVLTDGNHPGGWIQYRTISISYGEWTDMEDPAARQERARLVEALKAEGLRQRRVGNENLGVAYLGSADFLSNLGGAS